MVARWLRRSDSRSEGAGCGRLEGDGGMVGRVFWVCSLEEVVFVVWALGDLRGRADVLSPGVGVASVSVGIGGRRRRR